MLIKTARTTAALMALTFLFQVSMAQASTLTPALGGQVAPAPQLRQGDFDGDGRLDDLALIRDADTGRIAVHVLLNRADGVQDLRVTSIDGSGNAPVNLQVVQPGSYDGDCGTYASDCAARVTAAHDSLLLGADGATAVLLHWQDDHFEQDFVRAGEALMAHVLAGLLARLP